MELKVYAQSLIKRWRIVLPVFLVTFIATVVFTYAQPEIYRSEATYIVRVGTTFKDDKSFVNALDILSRRVEIASTYAEVATSRQIKQLAIDDLSLSSAQRKDLSVNSRLIPGTNILEISVEGNDPVVARDFTNAIGIQTVVYVQSLYEAYELEPLDEATLPRSPIRPNKALNFTLGGILGLVLGVGLAFIADYMQTPAKSSATSGALEQQTGLYTQDHFALELHRELVTLQMDFDAAQRQLDQTQAALVGAEQRAEEARTAMTILEAQANDWHTRQAQAEQMAADRQDALNILAQQLTDTQARLTDVQHQAQTAEEALGAANIRLGELHSQQEELTALRARLDVTQFQLEETQAALVIAERRAEDASATVSTLEMQVENWRARLEDAERVAAERQTTLATLTHQLIEAPSHLAEMQPLAQGHNTTVAIVTGPTNGNGNGNGKHARRKVLGPSPVYDKTAKNAKSKPLTVTKKSSR